MPDSSADGEVQYLYSKSTKRERIGCQVCDLDLTDMSEKERVDHYDDHCGDEPEIPVTRNNSGRGLGPSKPPSSKSSSGLRAFLQRSDVPLESKNVFWYAAKGTPPPNNFTPGLIPLLKRSLQKNQSTVRAWLCSEVAVHIQSEPWDRRWGCGYRNFLMACAALIAQNAQPFYFPLLDDPLPPGIRNLQLSIEDAWANGYDKIGAEQLRRELVDTSKWIGTTELHVAFTSKGIPSNLVDFILPRKDPTPLLDWVFRYFSQTDDAPKHKDLNTALWNTSSIIQTDKMPLILQHAGHSRTIVGYEKCKKGDNLLMFDPSKWVPPAIRSAALANSYSSLPPPTNHASGSKPTSGVLNHILHPSAATKGKRRASAFFYNDDRKSIKRVCSGDMGDAIVVDDDDDDAKTQSNYSVATKPSSSSQDPPGDVLKVFRVKASSINKEKYQILYFPLTDPLDESQKLARRVVTSVKIS